MRTVFLVFLLFFISPEITSKTIFDKIDELTKEFVEEYDFPGDPKSIRDGLSEKIQEIIDKYKVDHPKPSKPPSDDANDDDDFNKFKDLWNKLKQEQDEKINNFKAKVKERLEEQEAKKQKKNEERKKKWEDFQKEVKAKINETNTKILEKLKENKVERTTVSNSVASVTPIVQLKAIGLFPDNLTFEKKKQLVDELFTVFEGIVNATKIKKAEEKQKRDKLREELQPAIDEFFTQLRDKISAWKAAKEEEEAQRWADLQVILSTILDRAVQKIQEKNAARKDFWNKIHEKVSQLVEGTTAKPAVVENKATILDQISGTSAWQNITWVLLSICVFLAVALLGTICYQNKHKNQYLYQKLPGDDGAPPPLYPKLELQQEF